MTPLLILFILLIMVILFNFKVFSILLCLLSTFLICKSIMSPLAKGLKVLIIFISSITIVSIIVMFVFESQYNMYPWQYLKFKTEATRYISQLVGHDHFDFLAINDKGCHIYEGCIVEVKLRNQEDGSEVTIYFKDRRIIPMVIAK